MPDDRTPSSSALRKRDQAVRDLLSVYWCLQERYIFPMSHGKDRFYTLPFAAHCLSPLSHMLGERVIMFMP